ncbi:hypothetical protein VHUM_04278 [Vanrija humicola]|uniref:Wax synthase domain-containing protein n=1 Tax=Vanrija humicola TaxID=5417 RepID=A0A7D8UVX5_VANHU|nr:hypothetical protein VHUM_04278 [Vanrija humicola]
MALGRSRHIAAFDVCINSRLVSLRSVGLDTLAGPPNAALPKQPHVERHLRHKRRKRHPRPTTRAGSVARHVRHALVHYVVLDTMLALLRLVGPDTLGTPHGTRNVLDKFVNSTRITALPGFLGWVVPSGGVRFLTELCVPLAIWQALSCGYHALATACIGSGLWEVQSWDVDLFDSPWRADSIIDLWGKRWHQMFRHQFIILSVATTRALGIKIGSHALFLLTFVFSGLLHAFGELSMDPVPEPWKLGSFFVLAGLGCAIEVSFKRATGHRVKGLLGRIWTWTFMFFAGSLATNAWLDGGIAGCTLLPAGGAGEYIAPFVLSKLCLVERI